MKKKKKIIITISAIIAIIIAVIVAIKILGIKAGSPEEGTNGEVAQNTDTNEPSNPEPTREVQTITQTQTPTRSVSPTDTSKWDLNRVNPIEDTAGIKVPVPKGYTASSIDGEHTVNTGFVIYEGEEAVTDENKDAAQTTRDQWVWVPVENMSDIYFTDSNGKKHGQLWDFSTTGRTKKSYTAGSGYREPDRVTSYDKSTQLPKNEAEYDQTELNEELQDEFEYCINSIEKYGGFYIGRYETGNLSKPKAKVVKGNTDISSQTWYTMYKKSKQIVPNGNKNVRTSMIWGSLWDHTLNFLVTSGNKQYSEITNSTSWGNYSNNTVSRTWK